MTKIEAMKKYCGYDEEHETRPEDCLAFVIGYLDAMTNRLLATIEEIKIEFVEEYVLGYRRGINVKAEQSS